MADLALLSFPPVRLPGQAAALRAEVRAFLAAELAAGGFVPRPDAWLGGHSAEFSRKLAARGWIGMTWPRRYGGGERSQLERYVVTEELLAAGAPVAAHWIADRQSGPLLLRYGTEAQRARFLPAIARGECYFAIGMSEPEAGSDLAAARTAAQRVAGGWRLSGRKLWTSHAHAAHYVFTLCRTAPPGERRHEGFSQLIVPLDAPGVTIRPIRLLNGARHFNEVILDDVHVPDDLLVGEPGRGWEQVTSELAYERSGPERLLSTFPLVVALLRALGPDPDRAAREVVGRLTANLWALRRLSQSVATALDAGRQPNTEAALVKDLGTRFEQDLVEAVRGVLDREPDRTEPDELAATLAEAILAAPGFTLRGGTNEILRGSVARALGLR